MEKAIAGKSPPIEHTSDKNFKTRVYHDSFHGHLEINPIVNNIGTPTPAAKATKIKKKTLSEWLRMFKKHQLLTT